MKKRNLTSLFAALVLTVVAGSSFLCGNGIVSYEGETDGATMDGTMVTTEHCSDLRDPVFGSINVYYCFVGYSVRQPNDNTMNVQFWQVPNDRAPLFSYNLSKNNVRWVFAPAKENSTEVCEPTNLYVRAVCPTCGASTAQIPVNYFTKLAPNCTVSVMKMMGTIPTTYDSAGWVWDHGLGFNDEIKFTIAHRGIAQDGEVTIPLIGYSSKSIEIEGVTFTVRTGPNRVSIKADSYVTCDSYSTMFGFSVEQ